MKIADSTINMASSREYTESDRERIEIEERWETILNDRMDAAPSDSPRSPVWQRFATTETVVMETDSKVFSGGSPQDAFRQRLSIMRTEAIGASFQRVHAVDIALLQEQQQKMEELMNKILDSLFSESGQEGSIDLTMVGIDFSEVDDTLERPESNVPEFNFSETGEPLSLRGFSFPELAYTRTETTIHSHYEKEDTGFSADGVVKTADGREIDFNLDLAMGREFLAEERFTTEESGRMKLIDPLVINFEGHAPQLSDTKFSFDINIDGEEDEISRLLPGSAFLAFDLNGNGLVDDGSELFGARTGNGFFELAEYDMDNNSWIDENDPVYGKLSLWRMGDEGEDTLESLKDAGIGAIHLESRETMFNLTDEENNLQGRVEETGVFLKEEGGAGTIQQVKFTV